MTRASAGCKQRRVTPSIKLRSMFSTCSGVSMRSRSQLQRSRSGMCMNCTRTTAADVRRTWSCLPTAVPDVERPHLVANGAAVGLTQALQHLAQRADGPLLAQEALHVPCAEKKPGTQISHSSNPRLPTMVACATCLHNASAWAHALTLGPGPYQKSRRARGPARWAWAACPGPAGPGWP